MPILDGQVIPNSVAEFNVKLAEGLTFKQWGEVVRTLRENKVSSLSKAHTTCPNCHIEVPTTWSVYVTSDDEDLA